MARTKKLIDKIADVFTVTEKEVVPTPTTQQVIPQQTIGQIMGTGRKTTDYRDVKDIKPRYKPSDYRYEK